MKHAALAAGLVSVILVVGCGGSPKPAPAPAPQPVGATPVKPGPATSAELEAFHDLLAPLWHDEGEMRLDGACFDSEDLLTSAAAVKSSSSPGAVDGEAWQAAGETLHKRVEQFGQACEDGNRGRADALFTQLHDAFHAMLELTGGGNGHDHDGGEHDHDDGEHDHDGGEHDHDDGEHD